MGEESRVGRKRPSRFERRDVRTVSLQLVVAAALVFVMIVVANGVGALTFPGAQPTSTTTASDTSSQLFAPSATGQLAFNGQVSECDYLISMNGTVPVAQEYPSGRLIESTFGANVGPFVNTLIAPNKTYCFAAGNYTLNSAIQVSYAKGVTLDLDPHAVMQLLCTVRVRTCLSRVLLVYASPDTKVVGGEWIGPGRGNGSAIRVQFGSNNTVIEDTDVTRAGWDGILIYDNSRPSYNVSVLDNNVHGNGRFGIQEFSNTTTGTMGTLIEGNVAVDNRVGGIYTNGIAGVTIAKNVVRNSVGNGPGEIGIGVTNGHNDTVTENQVDHMGWFGIQAYYNNYTVISDNIATWTAGGEDQSGITNDHSSFDTVVGNVVESNAKYGIYVERSWNVTVSANVAANNSGYGIALYHGSWPTMGKSQIVGNICTFNGLGGIILNSAIDNVISMNQCTNNAGDGILLYNDPGQAGSTGNTVSNNWVGNEAGSAPTQTVGIGEGNDSFGNVFVSNVVFNNTSAALALVGPDASASP